MKTFTSFQTSTGNTIPEMAVGEGAITYTSRETREIKKSCFDTNTKEMPISTFYDTLSNLLFFSFLSLSIVMGSYSSGWAQGTSASATYTSGNISTDIGFVSYGQNSSCPGTLTVTIPTGAIIRGVDVKYSMTGASDSWTSDQRSQFRCTSTGGTSETSVYSGYGETSGQTINYSRYGLTIANNVTGGGTITFQLHAGRTWGGSGCNTTYQYVNNNSWTVTIHYDLNRQQTFCSSGTFTVPSGVSRIDVECWGGGGAGGGNTATNREDGGGGGGGGGYSKATFTGLTQGTPYTVTVGTGGTGSAGDGGNGTSSWFDSSTTLLANAGSGGKAPVSGNGGVFGAGGILSSYGSTKFSGGNGGTGRNNNDGAGGPGGSSAGTEANGTSGPVTWSTVTAGTAPTGGGIGGNGGNLTQHGLVGTMPGGGGGGGGEVIRTGSLLGGYTYHPRYGGNGANGLVVITWPECTNVSITSVTAAASPICSGLTTTLTANGVVGTNFVVTWWSGTGGTGTNYGTGLTLSNASPGTYFARVTGDCGSPVEASVTVGEYTLPTCSITGSDAVCASSTGNTYSGPGGMTSYSWSISGGTGTIVGASNNQSAIVTAGTGASFTLSLTINNGTCNNTCQKTVTINALPSARVDGHVDVACYGGTGTITVSASSGTAPYQFSLDNGGTYTTGSNPNPYTFTGKPAGTYYPRVIDANNCQSASCQP